MKVRRLPPYPEAWQRYFHATSSTSERADHPDGAPIPQGQRDATLASLAGTMRRVGLTQNEIAAALQEINQHRCDPPLDERDIRRIARSISSYTPGTPELATILLTGTLDTDAPPTDPASGWEPKDAVELANHPHNDPDVGPIFYSGLRHVLSSEPEGGKSLLCLAVAADEILCGRHVLYLDFDGMGATMSVDLLRCLNVPDQLITTHFLYVTPETPFAPAKERVLQLLDKHTIRLVVIDTFNPALGTHGLDSEKTSDTDVFYRTVVDPLRSRGAAVVLLDHVTKSKDTRGRYSYGAEGKLSRCDVAIGIEARQPIGRGRVGIVSLKTYKDRPSRLPRPTIGTITWTSSPDTGQITWELKKTEPVDHDKPFRPTAIMEAVYLDLLQYGPATSQRDLERRVPKKAEYVRLATKILTSEGHIARAGNGFQAVPDHPYSALIEATASGASQCVPSASGTQSGGASDASPPLKGDADASDPSEDARVRPDPNTTLDDAIWTDPNPERWWDR